MDQEILNLLQDILPDIDFTASEELVDDGILDSLSIVTIVGELSIEYNIELPYEEIIPQNFNSVGAIASLVERYRK